MLHATRPDIEGCRSGLKARTQSLVKYKVIESTLLLCLRPRTDMKECCLLV